MPPTRHPELVELCATTQHNEELDRARAKLVQIERELKKFPDFQLYLIAKSHSDRARMKHLLMEIPHFRLWRVLANVVKRAGRRAQTLQKQSGYPYETTPV